MRGWLVARSVVLWTLSCLHFAVAGLALTAAAALLGHRRLHRPVRAFSRNVVRLLGARLEVRAAPGFDPSRTYLFVSNHVNLFDPFVLCASIPQLVRGLELESHFQVPVYGRLMRRFGNVPVPDERTPAGLKRTYRLTREALESGMSLVVFPEGSRTRDGSVGPFENGAFRMARTLGYPVAPVTIAGSFQVLRTGDRLLRPGRIVVHLHEPVDPASGPRDELRARVRETIRAVL